MLRYNSSITLCTRINIYVLLKIGPGAEKEGEKRGKRKLVDNWRHATRSWAAAQLPGNAVNIDNWGKHHLLMSWNRHETCSCTLLINLQVLEWQHNKNFWIRFIYYFWTALPYHTQIRHFCVVEVVAEQFNIKETKERSLRGLEVLTRHFLSCTARTLILHKRSTLQEVAP